jgi:DNA-binding XRE family transcriptional regulator
MGMNVGLTQAQLSQSFSILEKSIGQREADTAKEVLTTVVAARRN